MAIMATMFWIPNTTEAGPNLRENLLGFRNAARSAGFTCDVVSLIPGGGGVQGEMGLAIEYADGAAYSAALDAPPAPEIVANQQSLKSSDARPDRSSTLMEIPGTEVPYGDLPKGLIQVSINVPLPGKAADAVADMRKSQQIMGRLGIKVRVTQAFLGNPFGAFAFMQYYESGAAWGEGVNALGQDEEWQAHFARASDNRQIIRQSVFGIEG